VPLARLKPVLESIIAHSWFRYNAFGVYSWANKIRLTNVLDPPPLVEPVETQAGTGYPWKCNIHPFVVSTCLGIVCGD